MKISLTTERANKVVAVGIFNVRDLDKNPLFKTLGKNDRDYLRQAARSVKDLGKESHLFHLPSNPKKSVLVFGLGEKRNWDRRQLILSARKLVSLLKQNKLESATVNLEDFSLKGTDMDEIASLVTQNFIMAEYAFVEYKERPKDGWPKISELSIYSPRPSKKVERAIKDGGIIGNAVNECRRLANTPGGLMTPKLLAGEAGKLTKKNGVKIKVLGEKEMEKLGMGGVLGVSSGSSEEAQFIIMEYGTGEKPPIVLVGKGITFDSGGIDIKTGGGAVDMKMDMSGGAAVITAICAIAQLKVRTKVVGIIPTAENMPSGSSYRPGDLLKTITGRTIEVLNTDAEGRIILADGLGYAQKYKPSLIVDVATLTGAAMVALGDKTNALFSNQERLLSFGKKIGERTGDYAWPMPLWKEYDEEIKGTFGDVANTGKTRYGGAITAAAFLKQFVGDYPWIHLDIAPMMISADGQNLEKGASGTGVRFLVELVRTFK